jgi:RNA polymerase sigma factor (sigma-70 family)
MVDDEPADVTDALAVRAAVAALPPRQRAAVVLRYFADLSVDQTAAVLGCAPGTVKSLTSQAIASLRDRFEVEVTHA